MTEQWTAPGPGTWMQDRAHLPASTTPMLQATFPAGMARGFGDTFAQWGALLDTMQQAFVNGFPYMQPLPFDAPGPEGPRTPEYLGAEIGRRAGVAAAAFEQKIWNAVIEHWDAEVKPASVAAHRALAEVDLASLDDPGLRTHLHRCIDHATSMFAQHHRYNGIALVPVADFVLRVAAWTGRPPVPLFMVFDGWSPVSGINPIELQPAIAALRNDPDGRALLESDRSDADVVAALRARIPALDDYVRGCGFRLAAGFDITNPTIGERPELVRGRVRAALEHDHDSSLDRAEALAQELRAAVPAEHQAEFDEMLVGARRCYRMRDERGIYSDAAAVGLLRLALIELGRRMTERGRLGFMYDALDLRVEEIDGLLDGSPSPTAAELASRVARRKELSAAGAPPFLGDPPHPPPPLDGLPPSLVRVMSAFGFAIQGVLGEAESPSGDHALVIGIGGSAGHFEGPACVVRNFDDLWKLAEGDVLVTSATGESFNAFLHLVGAIVTDHGSFASHAAIMGREMGFPAVVGTVNGSSRIPHGAVVRVDGKAGTVEVVSVPDA
jgi:pyruvate,water dikinase